MLPIRGAAGSMHGGLFPATTPPNETYDEPCVARAMKHRHLGLLASYGLLAREGFAFLAPSPRSPSAHRRGTDHHDSPALSMAWSAEERTEILRGLVDWQERDLEGVGAAGVKILTESSPTAGVNK